MIRLSNLTKDASIEADFNECCRDEDVARLWRDCGGADASPKH
jgi:hypothetical protein